MSDLDIHANTPSSLDCKDSKFIYPSAGHVITGNLKIIPESRIRNIVSKGPKYRFPSQIDFNRCREEIVSALNEFGNRWCKRESVESNAMKERKLSIFSIVDKRIKFYSKNTNLLPPKKSNRKAMNRNWSNQMNKLSSIADTMNSFQNSMSD